MAGFSPGSDAIACLAPLPSPPPYFMQADPAAAVYAGRCGDDIQVVAVTIPRGRETI